VISISDNQNLQFRQYSFDYAPAAAGAEKSLPIAAGEQSMDVTVHLVFAIYPAAGK